MNCTFRQIQGSLQANIIGFDEQCASYSKLLFNSNLQLFSDTQ